VSHPFLNHKYLDSLYRCAWRLLVFQFKVQASCSIKVNEYIVLQMPNTYKTTLLRKPLQQLHYKEIISCCLHKESFYERSQNFQHHLSNFPHTIESTPSFILSCFFIHHHHQPLSKWSSNTHTLTIWKCSTIPCSLLTTPQCSCYTKLIITHH